MKQRIINSYKAAGIQIPKNVKNLFKIESNNSNLPTNAKRAKINVSTHMKKNKIMIGTRECMRYSRKELQDMARRLSIMGTDKMKKEQLCKAIREKSTNNISYRVSSTKPYSLIIVNNKLKIITLPPKDTQGERREKSTWSIWTRKGLFEFYTQRLA